MVHVDASKLVASVRTEFGRGDCRSSIESSHKVATVGKPKYADVEMVKQKNHTARNNTVKAHRNGIKKPKIHRFTSTRGVRVVVTAVNSRSEASAFARAEHELTRVWPLVLC